MGSCRAEAVRSCIRVFVGVRGSRLGGPASTRLAIGHVARSVSVGFRILQPCLVSTPSVRCGADEGTGRRERPRGVPLKALVNCRSDALHLHGFNIRVGPFGLACASAVLGSLRCGGTFCMSDVRVWCICVGSLLCGVGGGWGGGVGGLRMLSSLLCLVLDCVQKG